MYQRILVPVDGSPTSDLGLAEAIKLAKLTGGRLRLVHVIDELSLVRSTSAYGGYSNDWLTTMRAAGAKVLADAHATAVASDVQAEECLSDNFQGAVHEMVCADAASWPADLIVIGTHGRRGVSRMVMGSSAEHIARLSPVPVLLVHDVAAQAHRAKVLHGLESLNVHLPAGVVALE
ncbi:MAG: universal stress protein [Variovorax sp.]|nr:universal stress protein [Variovorax sp.]